MGRNRKIGSAHSQLFTNLISVFYVYTKLETVSLTDKNIFNIDGNAIYCIDSGVKTCFHNFNMYTML